MSADGSYTQVNHLVLSTGFSGEPRLPDFPRDEFKGVAIHSSSHKGSKGWEGKRCVTIGSCNSAHDIAQYVTRCLATTRRPTQERAR